MVLEASKIIGSPVVLAEGKKIATVDKIIFDGSEAKIVGFQVGQRALLQSFSALDYANVLSVERDHIVVDDPKVLDKNLKPFDQLRQRFGTVIGSLAKTESGTRLGRITDLIFEVESGFIVRFYIGALLRERIIPRQFLVSVTPKAVIFKDVVNAPVFDNVAISEAAA